MITREVYLAERERHDNTVFGSFKDRTDSHERVIAALRAWREEFKHRVQLLLSEKGYGEVSAPNEGA